MTTSRARPPRVWGEEWPAPAKINLFLHVLGVRADGFHQLETQFQFLEFADTLRFKALDQPTIRRIDQHDFQLPEDDLSVRAAKLLQATHPAATERGVAITLHKVIPPGSGLGGGSSNAATTLMALNHLWQLGLTRNQLAELGLQLGADVPLFVHGRAALAHGIGELLEPTEPPERWLCVCLPPVNVSTATVFAHPQLTPTNRPHSHTPGNDLEPITTQLHPEVGDALAHLRKHANPNAQMSGSGGAVYAQFNSRAQATTAAEQLPADLNAFVTRSLNRHPLLDFCRRASPP